MAHGAEQRGNVFVSYSRDDLNFADQLAAALGLMGFAVMLDRQGISGGEDWKRRLGLLIRDADTVVFVLSRSSALSEICAWEVAEAVNLGKRVIPVVCRSLEHAQAPPQLADLNYIFFHNEANSPGSGFGTGLVRLVAALNTDLNWLREHTRLLQRASEWESAGRAESRLLFGDSIAEAKAWAAQRPREAPEPTTLQYEFLRASEEADATRKNAERRQLEAMAAAQDERAKALAERDEVQKRETQQARRVVQRTFAGLIAALVFGAIAGIAGWNFYLGKLEIEQQKLVLTEANQRLTTELKLRIAPFGKLAYSIPEHWYKLATTNASSIVFIERLLDRRWALAGTGFLISGGELHKSWDGEVLLITANHVVNKADVSSLRITIPAVDNGRRLALKEYVWNSINDDLDIGLGVDVAVFRLAEKPPRGAKPVEGIAALSEEQWGTVEYTLEGVKESRLPNMVPLIIIGAAIDEHGHGETAAINAYLTLSLANALGTTGRGRAVFTDSTTLGASGSPVFDANTGRLFAIVQFGSSPTRSDDGLAYSAGVTLSAVKDALQDPISFGRFHLENGRTDLAQVQFEQALASDTTARKRIATVQVEFGAKLAKSGKLELAETQFQQALAWDLTAAELIAEVRDPEAAQRELNTHVTEGVALLKHGREGDAKARFALARSFLARTTTVSRANRASILNQIAWEWMRYGNPSEGLADIENAIALLAQTTSRVYGYLDTRGHILLGMDRADDALADFDRVISAGLLYSGAFYGRGRCHEIRGRKDAAIADYGRALQQPERNEDEIYFARMARERLRVLTQDPSNRIPG